MAQTFTRRTRIEASPSVVFDWHKRPGALERLTPPWQNVRVVERRGSIQDGDRTTLELKMAGTPVTWLVEHRDYVEGEQFRDLQLKGPFARWEHTHRFEPAGENACEVIDHIEYELPMGELGRTLGEAFTQRQLDRMFVWRHRTLAADLAEHARAARGRTLSIAVSGSHGLVGRTLIPFLTTGGHTVKRIVRGNAERSDEVGWWPRDKRVDTQALQGVDAVVHLAGEPIYGRWNEEKKRKIRDSRVQGTRGLCEALAGMNHPPGVLVSASAMGYYGDRGDELLTEDSPPGDNFLARVSAAWEQANQPAADAGVRVVNPRLGVVLSPAGGALAMMLPIFKSGAGGQVGGGKQWMSWISIEDVIRILYRAVLNEDLHGPVNTVAPEPVTNRQFTRTLGRVLSRPTLLPAPRFVLRKTFGQMADEMLLSSARVKPVRLAQHGYLFHHPDLEPALRDLLGC